MQTLLSSQYNFRIWNVYLKWVYKPDKACEKAKKFHSADKIRTPVTCNQVQAWSSCAVSKHTTIREFSSAIWCAEGYNPKFEPLKNLSHQMYQIVIRGAICIRVQLIEWSRTSSQPIGPVFQGEAFGNRTISILNFHIEQFQTDNSLTK